MSKKIMKLVVGMVLTVTISVSMFTLGSDLDSFEYDEPSETFVGVISDSSYGSKDETARAFLLNELTGATAQPIYSKYEKIKDLSTEDIENLALEQNLKSEIESAENIAVYYSCYGVNKRTNTCLLEMNGEYRYYVSLPSNGEALTNSYFDTVLDGAKYLNCTSTSTVNIHSTTNVVYRQTIMFDDDIAYFDQELPGMDYEMYFSDSDNSIDVYLEHPQKNDGKFYSLSEINKELRSQNLEYKVYLTKGGEKVWIEELSTLQDITDFMFMMQLDASYFEKTSTGFSMPKEKYKEVCKMMAGETAYAEMEKEWDKYIVNFRADYYVTDGRLSGSETSLVMSKGDDIFAMNIIVNYTDFGITEVMLPNSMEG